MNDYNIEALARLAAYGAPWQYCWRAVKNLTADQAPEAVEAAVLAQVDAVDASAIKTRFPEKAWMLEWLEGGCNDSFTSTLYFSMIIEMVAGLMMRGSLDDAALIGGQLLGIFERGSLGGLPEGLQPTIRDRARYGEELVRKHMIEILKRQGKAEEAMGFILAPPFFDFGEERAMVAAHMERFANKSPGKSAFSMLLYGIGNEVSFTEADEYLEKAFHRLDLRSPDLIAPDKQYKDVSVFFLERVVSLYLSHFFYRSAERWHLAKMQKFASVRSQFDYFQQYIDALYMASIQTGLEQHDQAEAAFKECIEIATRGSVKHPLFGAKLAADRLTKSLADYGMFLEKLGRIEESRQVFEQMAERDLDFEHFYTSLLQPTCPTFSEWCRSAQHGFGCAALFQTDEQLAARCVELLNGLLEKGKPLTRGSSTRLSFLAYGARVFSAAGEPPRALRCFEQAITLAENALASADGTAALMHPDQLIELLGQYRDLLHDCGYIEAGRLAQNRIESLKEQYFR